MREGPMLASYEVLDTKCLFEGYGETITKTEKDEINVTPDASTYG